MIADRRKSEPMRLPLGNDKKAQPFNRLSRAPAFDADGRLQEPTLRVHYIRYLTRDIADSPIMLQCEEPNL